MPVEFISIGGKVLPESKAKLNPVPVELEISDRHNLPDADIINYFKDIVKQYPDLAITEPQIEGNKIYFSVATMLSEPFNHSDVQFMLKEFTGMYERKFTLADKSIPTLSKGIVESNMIEDMGNTQPKVPRYFSSDLLANENGKKELLVKGNEIETEMNPTFFKFIGTLQDELKSSEYTGHHRKHLKGKDSSPELSDIIFRLQSFFDAEKYEKVVHEYKNILDLEKEDNAPVLYELLALWHYKLGDSESASAFHRLALNHFKEKADKF